MLASNRQRGLVAVLVLLLIVGIGAGAILVTGSTNRSPRLERDAVTQDALARAKRALLAYVVARDDPGRPGEFPCPTGGAPTEAAPTHNTYGDQRALCANTNLVGRFPWRTLGVAEIVDADGEPLWYVVSNRFKPISGTPDFSNAINSDARGTLVLNSNGASISEVVAIIFSAGPPLAGQMRAGAPSLCATTGNIISPNMCASNYLEAADGANNANSTGLGPFAANQTTTTFNDQAIFITTSDFIPQIEERLVKHVTKSLKRYFELHRYFPYAAPHTDIAITPRSYNTANNCRAMQYSGRFPDSTTYPRSPPADRCTGVADWEPTGSLNDPFPDWFRSNAWHTTMFYAVAKAFVKGGSGKCLLPGDCLMVDGKTNVQLVVVLPGLPTPTQTRPTASSASAGLNIQNYFEVPENLDAWAIADDYRYRTTASTLPSRDRVIALSFP
jgi:type II secretory pathway pseudopilin PulG